MNSLPKTVTRQRRGCDLKPGPSAPESSTLTTRLPSHPTAWCCMVLCLCVSKVFDGNADWYSVKHSYLDEPIIARFIKFHPIHWHQHPSARLELLGCQGTVYIRPMESRSRLYATIPYI